MNRVRKPLEANQTLLKWPRVPTAQPRNSQSEQMKCKLGKERLGAECPSALTRGRGHRLASSGPGVLKLRPPGSPVRPAGAGGSQAAAPCRSVRSPPPQPPAPPGPGWDPAAARPPAAPVQTGRGALLWADGSAPQLRRTGLQPAARLPGAQACAGC